MVGWRDGTRRREWSTGCKGRIVGKVDDYGPSESSAPDHRAKGVSTPPSIPAQDVQGRMVDFRVGRHQHGFILRGVDERPTVPVGYDTAGRLYDRHLRKDVVVEDVA